MRKIGLFLLMAAMPFCFAWAKDRAVPFPDAPYGANDREVAAALKNCDSASGEQDVQICAWDQYRREELKYRAAARAADKALAADAEGRALLAKANQAFEKFRQATCDFDGHDPGSMSGSLLYGCLEQYTHRRARALQAYARCEKTGHCQLPNLLYIDENEDEPPAERR